MDEDDERVLNLGGVSSKQRLEELANREDDIDRSVNDEVDRRIKREIERNRVEREKAAFQNQLDTEQTMGEREHRGLDSNNKGRKRGIFDKYEEYRYGNDSEYGEDLYQSSYTSLSYEELRARDEESIYKDDEGWTFITEEEYQAKATNKSQNKSDTEQLESANLSAEKSKEATNIKSVKTANPQKSSENEKSVTPPLNVAELSPAEKLGFAMKRAALKLPKAIGEQLLAMVNPVSLAMMVGVLGAYTASHAVGIGIIADAVMAVSAGALIGWRAVTVAKDIWGFAQFINATTEEDLDKAGQHLANAITTVGLDIILGILTKKAATKIRDGVNNSRSGVESTNRLPDRNGGVVTRTDRGQIVPRGSNNNSSAPPIVAPRLPSTSETETVENDTESPTRERESNESEETTTESALTLTPEQNAVADRLGNEFAQTIIERGQQAKYKKDKIDYIRQRLDSGKLVEEIGESRVRDYYSDPNANVWKNVYLQAKDAAGNNLGGQQSEIDFFVHYTDGSSSTEIVSAKLNGKSVDPARDLKNLRKYYAVNLDGTQAELAENLTNVFSKPNQTKVYENATNVVVKYTDVKTGKTGEIPLSEFINKVPEPKIAGTDKYSTKVRGLAPDDTATKKNLDYIKLGVEKEALFNKITNIIDNKI